MVSLLHASPKRKTFISFKLLHKFSPSLNKALVLEYCLASFLSFLSKFSSTSKAYRLITGMAPWRFETNNDKEIQRARNF